MMLFIMADPSEEKKVSGLRPVWSHWASLYIFTKEMIGNILKLFHYDYLMGSIGS
jgi:hypothetical protein